MTNQHDDPRTGGAEQPDESGVRLYLGKAQAFLWQHASAILTILAIVGAFLLGMQNGGRECHGAQAQHQHQIAEGSSTQLYTCPMHPKVQQDTPGNCSACSMDLVPLSDAERASDLPAPQEKPPACWPR